MLKGKREPMWLGRRRNGRQGAYESEQVAHVVERHALVGRVGKRGVEVLAVTADAFQHGVGELQLRPGADSRLCIGGDVRHLEGAERRVQLEPAAELPLVVLLGRCMARGAAADVEHDLAVGEACCPGSECIGRQLGRTSNHESDDAPEHGQDQGEPHEGT